MLYGETQLAVSGADIDGISVELFPGAMLHAQLQYDTSQGNSQAAQGSGQLRLIVRHVTASVISVITGVNFSS